MIRPSGLVLLLAVGCSPAYVPTAELWPTYDASVGLASSGTMASSGSTVSSGSISTGSAASTGSSTTGAFAVSGASGATGGSVAGASAGGVSIGPDAGEALSGSEAGTAQMEAGLPEGGGCSLSVTVTTVTDNGSYSPRNIGAIWIATGSAAFVKTLAVWAATRISHLTLWGSMTATAGLSRNTVDAITSATLSMHETHNV